MLRRQRTPIPQWSTAGIRWPGAGAAQFRRRRLLPTIQTVWTEPLYQLKHRRFSVSAMAFQDCWSLDLERLRNCYIHIMSPDGRLIPFCAYNLTSAEGRPLHRLKNR